MVPFTPNRTLLNPQFEGYKLSFTPSPNLRHIPLPEHATQSRPGIRALGFQQVASRVRHNHLAVGEQSALYIAKDGSVMLVNLDGKKLDTAGHDGVTLRTVFHLPVCLSTSTHMQVEYPAAAYLSQDTWLLSDGHGSAYLIRTPRGSPTAHTLAQWCLLVDDGAMPTPFRLHCATLVAPNLAIAIISSTSSNKIPYSSAGQGQYNCDLWAVHVSLPDSLSPLGHSLSPVPFELVWRLRGTHIPLFVTYSATREAFLIVGGSPYRETVEPSTQPYEPTPDELAPIPRAGESLDTTPGPVSPYSWTQTDESVTVVFALPGATPMTNIHVNFGNETLSLRIGSPPLPQPQYAAAPLWATIHPTSSLWTWERGNATTAGLLTLHLDKAHPGTRWSDVFAQGFEPHEVQETLDPSELAGIRENLDKYTASLQDGASGLGHGIPSLAEGERDDEVDANVGNSVTLTWVTQNGSTTDSVDTSSTVLLSLPLPGLNVPLSLVVKHDIDGPLYTLEDASWEHTATYPALGFVLASKRDTRFTFHFSSHAVLAFDSGARNDGGGNVYIYHGSAPGEKWAKQGVFQQQAGAGALLGVGAITSNTGQLVLLCLSEHELTVCSGLF